MLAYVFWHRPREATPRADYERGLTRFHEALGAEPPPGFQGSAVYRVEDVGWAPFRGLLYEDWYLLQGSAALDALNDAAISGVRRDPHDRLLRPGRDLSQVRRDPHDRVAALAGWGAAGLYRLRLGALPLAHARIALWMTKPPGERYEEFYRSLEVAFEGTPFALWGRQMALGLSPEFCAHLPRDLDPRLPVIERVALRLVWWAGGVV